MTTYIEYQLDENTTILVESHFDEMESTIKGTPRQGELIAISKAQRSFPDAVKNIKAQAAILLKEISELHVSEAEIKFGINTIGELGNMAIGKLGVGANMK